LLHRFEASERSGGFATTLTCCLFYLHSNKFRNLTKTNSGMLFIKLFLYYLSHKIILIVIFHLEVNRYVYVVVCGTCGKHTCSCTISLHHIALHIIRGCRRIFTVTVPVQHRTLPEEGYDAASYLVGYGGSGHDICIAFALIVILYISDMHWYECGYEDMII
jgi:hypothetical protein